MLALILAAAIASTSSSTKATTNTAAAPAIRTATEALTRPATKPTTTSTTKPAKPATPPAAQVAKPAGPEFWELIAQRKDRPLRQATLDRVATMLAGSTSAEQARALTALSSTSEIRYDRQRFTPLIRAALTSPEFTVRAAALRALQSCGITQDDLQPVAQLAHDPSPAVRSAVPATLIAANGRVGSPELDAAMLALLADENGGVRETALRSINNIDVSGAVEAKILSLWDDPKVSKDATIQALMSRPTVQGEIAHKMIVLLDEGDPKYAWRATNAIRNAMLEGNDRERADAALMRVLDDSLDVNVRDNCVNALAKSPSHAAWLKLQAIAADPDETDRIRDLANRVMRQ